MMHDLKYAFRTLVRQPVFSVVALLTLALGIGANTAIFSLVKGVLLDALPYNDSEELVAAWERKPEGGTEFVSPPTFLDWKDPIGKIIDNPHGKAEVVGVIAYSMSQRTTEMGLRMELGASGVDLVRLVVRNSMTLVGLGMAFGLIAALGLTRFLSGQLYGVGTLDPAVFVSVAVVLGLAAFVASYLPARRATRVDPIEALRVE